MNEHGEIILYQTDAGSRFAFPSGEGGTARPPQAP